MAARKKVDLPESKRDLLSPAAWLAISVDFAKNALMSKLVCALIVAAALLVGHCRVSAEGPIAWDGLGQDPNNPPATRRSKLHSKPTPQPIKTNAQLEKALSTIEANSAAWWALNEEIDAENERQMQKKLAICPRCLPK